MAEKDIVKAVILRAYWDANGDRHNEGEIVEVSKDALIAGMATGILAPVPKD